MNQFKTVLNASAAIFAILVVPGVASAQTAAPATTEAQEQAKPETYDPSGVDIVVTAQRRQERVQDIPVAISAFSGEQLSRSGTISLDNIAPRVPSFYFGSFGALRPQLYIRGIGTRSFDPGSESSVGVFEDEVYLGRSSGSFGALKDIERVEVLRGPQGTLYGRNTIGGAINVITKGPTPEFEGTVEAGISNYKGYDIFGAVGGPITSDKSLMFRVAGWHNQRDGYVTNLTTGNKFQGIDNSGGRARLAFEPSTSFRVDLTAEYLHDGDRAAFGGVNEGTVIAGVYDPNRVFFAAASRQAAARPPVDSRHAYLSLDPKLERNSYSYIGKVEGDLGGATLTSVSSYRKLDVADTRDLEGSSLRVIDQYSTEKSEQFTQEVRLTSEPNGPLSLGGALDWIVGGFYYHDTSSRVDRFEIGVDSAVRAPLPVPTIANDIIAADFKIKSYALFGQAVVHIGDAFDVTLGGRYTKDTKRVAYVGTTTDASPLISAPFAVVKNASYHSFDPRVVLTYKFSPDVNVYASYSTGFKSGGFQYAPFNLGSANIVFNPEDITAYEAGFKSEWLDRQVRLNVAAFHYDYKDLQVSRIIDTPSGPATLISNAASSKVNGVDVELLLRPSNNIDFSVAYGYLDAKYDNYVFNIASNLRFDGTVLVRAPEHSINVGAEWRIPFGDKNRFTLRADYALLGTFYHEPGEGQAQFGVNIPLTREEGYGLLDLRATVEVGQFRVSAYATNVLDQKYRRTINALTTFNVGFAGTPRIYGIRGAFNF